MTRRHPRDDGFTLIEALVALAIGGFVIAVLATVSGQWMRQWRVGLPALQRAEQLVAGLDRVAADLAAARFVPAGPDTPGLLFTGEPSAVTFARRTLPVERPGGLEVIRLAPLAGNSDVTLARSRTLLRFGTAAPAPSDTGPVVLLRAPYAVRFAYADTDRRWQARWTAPARLPALVQVAVIDRRSGLPVIAPVVVAVRMEAPIGCADLQSGVACDTLRGIEPAPETPTVADGSP